MRLGLKTYRHISRKLRTLKKIFFYSFKKLLLLFLKYNISVAFGASEDYGMRFVPYLLCMLSFAA